MMRTGFRVTLTETTNGYLTLPAQGEIQILETSTTGRVTAAVFREQRPDGTLAAGVQVREPGFIYQPS